MIWDKYLYNRLPKEDKDIIDKLKSNYNQWKDDHSIDREIINFENFDHVGKNIDLIEVQLYSLLKQLNFNRHLYIKEMKIFSEYPPRKHLEMCIKSFYLSIKEVLVRHDIELVVKIHPLERQLYEDLSASDRERFDKMDVDDVWGPFYIVDQSAFRKDSFQWPMTVGGNLITPVRLQIQQWLAPWVALPTVATPNYFATSGACANAAQEKLMNWEETVIEIVLKQLRQKLKNA
jgi:hypothetical protein